MRFKVATSDITASVAKTQGVLRGKKTDASQSCVTIEAKANRVTVSATNHEMTISSGVAAEVTKDGATLVHGRSFYDALRALPGSTPDVTVGLTTTERQLEVVCERIRYAFLIGPTSADSRQKTDDIAMRQAGQKLLLEMIDKTLYAASDDSTRSNICGLHFEPAGDGVLRIVATDGHRLSLVEKPVGFPVEFKPFVLGTKSVQELRRLLTEDARTDIGWDDRRFVVTTVPETTLVTHFNEGRFPEYRQIIVDTTNKRAIVERKALIATLHRLALIQAKGSPAMAFAFEPERLTLSAQALNDAEANEELAIDYEGEPVRIGCNAQYAIDAMGAFDDDKIEIRLEDPFRPLFISAPGGTTQLALIMPSRI